MSHFSVLITGPNIEEQLQPFHEFECTGTNDQYIQEQDVTEECREKGLDWYGLEDRTVDSESEINREGEHKYGYAILNGDGTIVKAIKRTNPNSKWDWWVVGGRWSNFLKLKLGEKGERGIFGTERNEDTGFCDQALKGNVDFEGMRNTAGAEAKVKYDRAVKSRLRCGFAGDATWLTWEHVRDVMFPGHIDKARAFYNEQPVLKAVSNVLDEGPFANTDQYLLSREVYIQQARNKATVSYAVLHEGQWISRGEMGWFGCSNDKLTQEEWNSKVNEMLDSLPDNTLLTVVDCHI